MRRRRQIGYLRRKNRKPRDPFVLRIEAKMTSLPFNNDITTWRNTLAKQTNQPPHQAIPSTSPSPSLLLHISYPRIHVTRQHLFPARPKIPDHLPLSQTGPPRSQHSARKVRRSRFRTIALSGGVLGHPSSGRVPRACFGETGVRARRSFCVEILFASCWGLLGGWLLVFWGWGWIGGG